MDHHQHASLIKLLLRIPDIQRYTTRTALLAGIPNITSLTRDEENAHTDINQLVTQLADLYLATGEPALAIFLENVRLRIAGTSLEPELLQQQRHMQSQEKPLVRDVNEAVPALPCQNNAMSLTIARSQPILIAYIYAPEDKKYYEELEKHFSTMKKEKLIVTWHQEDIMPGANSREEFRKALQMAEIVLLLVSTDWLSAYLYEQPLLSILERHKQGLIQAIPIILRSIDPCELGELSELTALPREKRPITAWKGNREAAFSSITRDIRQVVEELRNKPGRAIK